MRSSTAQRLGVPDVTRSAGVIAARNDPSATRRDALEQWFRTATQHHRDGELREAERLYRRLLRAAPAHVGALSQLSLLSAKKGKLAAAEKLVRRAIGASPLTAALHCDLANILVALTRLDEAAASFERALALSPDDLQALNNLGRVLQRLDRHDEAISRFARAAAIAPELAEPHNNLGMSLAALDRADEAMAEYRRAIKLKPADAVAHANKGVLLSELGQAEEARRELAMAVALAPGNAEFYRALAVVKRFTPGDLHVAAMEALAVNEAALSPGQQIELHFALGKAYEDLRAYDRSFGHYAKGNALKRQRTDYDEAIGNRFVESIRDTFTAELIGEKRGLGEPSCAPVFIIGMPRSGTTLVEQILASHPSVHGGGERQDLARLIAALRDACGVGFPGCVARLSGERIGRLGSDYVARLRAQAPGAARIVDKMPLNFRFAGLIHLALPNAPIVHVRRDPVDTCLSCFGKLFSGDLAFTYELGELGRYYRRNYEALMDHWRRVLPSGAILDVRYEDIVADLPTEARRLVAFCGLDWDDACLAFHRSSRRVRTASTLQVRQPLYGTSIGRWRPDKAQLQPLLDGLGIAG
jgi:tetratricopeptide (TPR) repeat protein